VFGRNKYVRAKSPGLVESVCTGMVVVDGKAYKKLKATFVQPGQTVAKNQVIGKK
jgi:hypothetical protein